MKSRTKLGLAFGTFAALLTVPTMFAFAESLNRQLEIGMSGNDVGTLQIFLAKDPSVYPQGKVTNYFGYLTKSAVSNFQSKNGISAIGRVGPQTLSFINSQMSGNITYVPTSNQVRAINPVSVNMNGGSVNVSWSTPTASKAVLYYSTSPLSTYENENSVTLSGSTIEANKYQTSQNVQIPNIQTGVTYYYAVYTTDQNGNVNMTWPATFRF